MTEGANEGVIDCSGTGIGTAVGSYNGDNDDGSLNRSEEAIVRFSMFQEP